MPIQIPQLKQNISTPDPAQTARLPVEGLPDASKEAEKTTKDVVGAGVAFADYQTKVENDAADTEATSRANEYEVAFKKGIYGDGQTPGIKFQQGNPAELYSKFDDEMATKFKELSEDDSLPDKTRALVNKKLTDRANSLNYQRLTEAGYQQNKYDNDVADSTVELHKDRLSDATSFIKPGDPSTLAGVEGAIGDIRQTRLRQGLRTGSVVPDENGKSIMLDDDGKPIRVNVLAQTDYQIKKDLSDAVYNGMDNLIKSGNVQAAETMRQQYGDYVEAAKQKTLSADFLKASITDRAYSIAADGGKDMDTHLEGLDPALRQEVKDKALQIMNDEQRRQEQMKDRSSKNNYNLLANHVMQTQRAGGYAGVTDLEADPVFKNAIDRVTDPKQKEALYNIVEQPKTTPASVKTRIQSVMFGQDTDHPDGFRGMKPEDFQQVISGASKEDRTFFERRYEMMNSQTNSQANANYKFAAKNLEEQMQAAGVIAKDSYGHYSNADQIKITQAREQIDAHLNSASGAPMNLKEIAQTTKDIATKMKTGQTFQDVQSPPPTPKFQGSVNPPVVTPAPSGALVKGKTRVQWNQLYLKQGKGPATLDQLNKFIDAQP